MDDPHYDTADYYYYEFDEDKSSFSTTGEQFPFVIQNDKLYDYYQGTIFRMTMADENEPVKDKGMLGKFHGDTVVAQYEADRLSTLHTLKSPRIVQIRGRFGDELGTRGITMELCDCTLMKWKEERYRYDSYPTELEAWNLCFQLAEALSLIHDGHPLSGLVPETSWEPVLHGDIHESNIFVQYNIDGDEGYPNFKLANFGQFMTAPHMTLSDRKFQDVRELGSLMARLCTDPRAESAPHYSPDFLEVIAGANPPKGPLTSRGFLQGTLPSSAAIIVQKIRQHFKHIFEQMVRSEDWRELWPALNETEEQFKLVAKVVIPDVVAGYSW